MKEEKGIFWLTAQELTDCLEQEEIIPVDKISFSEIYPREHGKTINYMELGKKAQEKYMAITAKKALAAGSNYIFYNHRQKVSTTPKSIIIQMNFELYRRLE